MADRSKALTALTDTQKRLVSDNIGLVGVHLRRFSLGASSPRRDREREDLFQEGCLGLIKAAIAFRVERGIPFAAFALPRIHNAVSHAIQTRFATVAVPPLPKNPLRPRPWANATGPGEPGADPQREVMKPERPRVFSLSDDADVLLVDRRRHTYGGRHDPEGSGFETVCERLRGKYERALHSAGEAMAKGASTRQDRDKLVRVLISERFLIPQEESRTALRQIARQTQSSYARVAQCDKQLGEAIRRDLEADPEFGALRRHAARDSIGQDAVIDHELDHSMAELSANEFVLRFHNAAAVDQARMLHTLLQMSRCDMDTLVHGSVAGLPSSMREKLLRDTATPTLTGPRGVRRLQATDRRA